MKKAYSITTEASYYKESHKELFLIDGQEFQIMIGDYSEEGCTGEFSINWKKLGREKATPQLNMFSDSFIFLKEYSDLFCYLSEIDDMETRATSLVIEKLKELGFEDVTLRGEQ